MSDFLLTERRGAVLILTMNRPERRNAFTRSMLARMQEVLEEAAEDPEVRVVVLTGAGGAFCAGGDVKAMSDCRVP